MIVSRSEISTAFQPSKGLTILTRRNGMASHPTHEMKRANKFGMGLCDASPNPFWGFFFSFLFVFSLDVAWAHWPGLVCAHSAPFFFEIRLRLSLSLNISLETFLQTKKERKRKEENRT